MPKPATHIILKFDSHDTDVLYRASDGLTLACRQNITVIVGNDPNPAKKEHRSFIDAAHALVYLKRLGDLDVNEISDQDSRVPREQLAAYAEFDERHAESKIVQPGSNLALKN